MKKNILLILFALLLQVLTLDVQDSSAIPVFARKYKTSCSTCHIAIMKRNAFGDAFRKNGYRMPEADDSFVKEKPVSLGADAWKKMFPDAIWPGSLPGTLPIGFYGHQRATWKQGSGGTKDKWELDTPHELSMLFGGVWEEKISFFGEWLAWEEGKFGRDKLVNFEIQFNDIFMEDVFNVKIGKHEIMAIDSYKEDNRLTLEHYNTNNIKFDGTFNLRTSQPGIVANGIVFDRLEYAAGVVNGSNKAETVGGTSKNYSGNTLEDNNDKDYYGRVAYKLGGMALTGAGMGESLSTKENWRDDSVQFAAFGYWAQPTTHTLSVYGFDVRGKFSRYELGGAYVLGTNGEQDVTTSTEESETAAWFVEGQAMIFPWMYTIIRYEAENYKARDDSNSGDGGATTNDHDARWILNLTMLQRANLRWTLEQVYYPRDRNTDGSDGTNSFKVNLLFAF